MRIGGVASVAIAVALLVTGCADVAASPYAVPGVRVQGSVELQAGGAKDCWVVRYTHDGSTVEAPFALAPGYEARDVAMADPSIGQDVPGPALINPDGELVGFMGGTVVISAEYASLDDSRFSEQREACGWTSAPLAPEEPGGVWVDPDGLTQVVYLCSSETDSAGDQPPIASVLDECDRSTFSPVPSASHVP
jgi:hypothetical protein